MATAAPSRLRDIPDSAARPAVMGAVVSSTCARTNLLLTICDHIALECSMPPETPDATDRAAAFVSTERARSRKSAATPDGSKYPATKPNKGPRAATLALRPAAAIDALWTAAAWTA